QQRAYSEQRVQQHEREQRGLHAAPERIREMQRDHEQEEDGRGALDEPRPHARLGIAPALRAPPPPQDLGHAQWLADMPQRSTVRRSSQRKTKFSTTSPMTITVSSPAK